MARKFAVPIDLTQLELQNARVHNLAAAPSSPVTGQLYYDTVTNKLYYWNGTTWIDTTGGQGAILSSLIDAKGDLIVGTADNVAARKAVGADNTFLVAASGQSDGLQWRALATGDIGASLLQEKIATTDLTDWPRVAALDLNGQKITNVADGTAATDAASFGQLSQAVAGFDWKEPVRAATTANVTLAGSAPNTLDGGVTLVANDRILVKNQTTSSQNGVYYVSTLGTGANGTWTRALDADSAAELNGATVLIEEGAVGQGDIYKQTATVASLGSDTVTWTKVSEGNQTYAADGTTLTLTGTTFSIANGGVTGTQLAASVAGNGLAGGGGSALSVNVDSTTLEINADTLRIAAGAGGNGLTGGGGSALAVGAGTGISVAADSVAVDTAVVARKYKTTVGNASNTTFTINHALGNQWATVQVFLNSSPFNIVDADVQLTDANNALVGFAVAPSSNQYAVVVTA